MISKSKPVGSFIEFRAVESQLTMSLIDGSNGKRITGHQGIKVPKFTNLIIPILVEHLFASSSAAVGWPQAPSHMMRPTVGSEVKIQGNPVCGDESYQDFKDCVQRYQY
jgi:hypothetical protein